MPVLTFDPIKTPADKTPIIDIDSHTRVKQISAWGAFTSATPTAKVSEVGDSPWEEIRDGKTDVQHVVTPTNPTFTLTDSFFKFLKLTTDATGVFYVEVKYKD